MALNQEPVVNLSDTRQVKWSVHRYEEYQITLHIAVTLGENVQPVRSMENGR